MQANIRLVSGPIMPTIAPPNSPYLRREKFTWTGLAIANSTPQNIKDTSGNTTVKSGSICAKGLNVSLPCRNAVSSPSQLLAKACIISWIDMLNKSTTSRIAML